MNFMVSIVTYIRELQSISADERAKTAGEIVSALGEKYGGMNNAAVDYMKKMKMTGAEYFNDLTSVANWRRMLKKMYKNDLVFRFKILSPATERFLYAYRLTPIATDMTNQYLDRKLPDGQYEPITLEPTKRKKKLKRNN